MSKHLSDLQKKFLLKKVFNDAEFERKNLKYYLHYYRIAVLS